VTRDESVFKLLIALLTFAPQPVQFYAIDTHIPMVSYKLFKLLIALLTICTAGESYFVLHFSGNTEFTSVISEEVSASPAAVDCEFGCMLRLIDGSYLSGAVEKV
jgi:hypothetical protein